MFVCSITSVFAVSKKEYTESVIGSLISNFNNKIPFSTKNSTRDNTIHIPYVGMSIFIEFSDNSRRMDAVYSSTNPDVIYPDSGRLLALSTGEAKVSIICENEQMLLNIVVDSENPYDTVLQEDFNSLELRDTEAQIRQGYIQKAIDMVYLHWKPTSNLTGWKAQATFYANTWYTGMPYSQTWYQNDDIEFTDNLSNASDFYTTYYNSGYAMPRYGNDCSAFLAICWGLTYSGNYRWNTTKFWNYYDSIGSYSNLSKGDGLVSTSAGHAFICTINHVSDNYIVAYEQTPPYAVMTLWSYDDLSASNYKAITNIG